MIHFLINKVRMGKYIKRWREMNKHNYTIPKNYFDLEKVIIGRGTYGPLTIYSWGNPDEKLIIGNYCSIAKNVTFNLGGNHNIYELSTYPFKYKLLNEKTIPNTKGQIEIEDDVWLGFGSTILSGIRIKQGAIIGANTLVNKDVPAYAVVVGNPMRVVKYRFEEDIINLLINSKIFKKMNDTFIKQNIELLYGVPTKNNIEKIIALLDISNNKFED